LDILNFGRGHDISNCIKQLMEAAHGGYLWLEQLISIDMDLIAYIRGMPTWGNTPMQFLDGKTNEKALVKEMKKKYGTKRGPRKIIIKHISDATTRMATKIMACKLGNVTRMKSLTGSSHLRHCVRREPHSSWPHTC
jgi:hypothetical protein